MAFFSSPVAIGNRALQYLGALRIASFTDVSKQAAEVASCYESLRRAELRRTVWRFATRRAVLRPLTATTKRFVAPAWSASTVSYLLGRIVQDTNGTYWVCQVLHTSTASNGPGSVQAGQPQNWVQYFGPLYGDVFDLTVTYYNGELVYEAGSPNTWHMSLINTNLGNATSTAADWAAQGSATDLPVNFFVAAGPGVTISSVVRNIFPLPCSYLRITDQDPKVASTSTNSVSAGLKFTDWRLEGDFIVAAQTTPIILRFVADISDVHQMDDLFAEGLAARIAFSLCETITQSNIKLQALGAAYQSFVADARMVNLIETGSTEPAEKEYSLSQGPAGVRDESAGAGGAQQG